MLACRLTGEDRWCRRCGCQGEARDTVVRRLAHEPCGWRPTIVHVRVGRYRCQGCSHVWRQDMSQAADPRAKLSRGAVRWALTGVVVHHVTVARIPRFWLCPGRAANTAVLAEGERSLINDPTRFEGVRVIGVDEHVWRHTPYGDKNRHRHLGCDAHPRSHRSLPSPGYDPGPIQAGLQNLAGLPAPTRGARTTRLSRWMASPGSRAQPPKNSPAQGWSWIPSTSCTWPVMLSMSAAGAPGKNFTIGAGVPRIT